MDMKLTNGDLAIENNELVLIQGLEETAQNLQIKLKAYQGEWFLDLSQGLPWFQELLVKGQSLNVISGILKDAIISTPGVLELNEFELDYDNELREMSLKATVKSKEGDIVISETLPS